MTNGPYQENSHRNPVDATIRLRGCTLGRADFMEIEKANGIEMLDLGDSNVSDSDLAFISRLTSLRQLFLFNTKVTDEGLAYLSNLNALELPSTSMTHLWRGLDSRRSRD